MATHVFVVYVFSSFNPLWPDGIFDFPSHSEATLRDMGKLIRWVLQKAQQNRIYNVYTLYCLNTNIVTWKRSANERRRYIIRIQYIFTITAVYILLYDNIMKYSPSNIFFQIKIKTFFI